MVPALVSSWPLRLIIGHFYIIITIIIIIIIMIIIVVLVLVLALIALLARLIESSRLNVIYLPFVWQQNTGLAHKSTNLFH